MGGGKGVIVVALESIGSLEMLQWDGNRCKYIMIYDWRYWGIN